MGLYCYVRVALWPCLLLGQYEATLLQHRRAATRAGAATTDMLSEGAFLKPCLIVVKREALRFDLNRLVL